MAAKVKLDMTGYAGQPTIKFQNPISSKKNQNLNYNAPAGCAGKPSQKFSESYQKARKFTYNKKSQSDGVKNALSGYPDNSVDEIITRKSMLNYVNPRTQRAYYKTSWLPNFDESGKMEFRSYRKIGGANIEMNYSFLDCDSTYSSWKRQLDRHSKQYSSSLEFDKFLTVSENACRSDRPVEVKNREPPFANPDGPFEKDQEGVPVHRRDHLDRTLTPRHETVQRDCIRIHKRQ